MTGWVSISRKWELDQCHDTALYCNLLVRTTILLCNNIGESVNYMCNAMIDKVNE